MSEHKQGAGPLLDLQPPTTPREPVIKGWEGLQHKGPAVGGAITEPQINFPKGK